MDTLIDPLFPLIELHRHLDGNVRLATILELGRQHNIALPAADEATLRPHVQVTEPQPGVMAFIGKFKWMTAVMVDYPACRRIAYENVEDAKREGIDYVELRFSPWFMAETHSLDPVGVVEAVVDGVREGRRAFGIQVNLIGILSRTYGPQAAERELDALLRQREAIVALDLAGDEANFPGGLFNAHFERAREAGLSITVHAGESAGPESIWQAIRDLGARRIGHALRAIEDRLLLDHLADTGIGVESCPTSNVQTSCVRSFGEHPLRIFLEHGIKATLNTDDPGISAIDLRHEYQVAEQQIGLSVQEIRRLQQNALEVAFLSPPEKQALLAKRLTR